MMLAGVARLPASAPRFAAAPHASPRGRRRPARDTGKGRRLGIGSGLGPEYDDPSKAALRPATKKTFGDFQCNAAMAIAKPLKKNPEKGDELVALLEADDTVKSTLATPLEVAGPGFVNMRLSDDYLSTTVEAMAIEKTVTTEGVRQTDDCGGLLLPKHRQGDARRPFTLDDYWRCPRELFGVERPRCHKTKPRRRLGHAVRYALKHLGDNTDASISDLVAFYKEAKQRFDSDGDFKERAKRVVSLQQGDAATLSLAEAMRRF